jgi:hypothetical protein
MPHYQNANGALSRPHLRVNREVHHRKLAFGGVHYGLPGNAIDFLTSPDLVTLLPRRVIAR